MSVGRQLREVRVAQALSLTDVTTATKIQPWVLEALEADKLQDQMSPIYARGFLSSYARFLKVPAEPLLAQFQGLGEPPVALNPSIVQIQSELKRQAAAVAERVATAESPKQPAAAVKAPKPAAAQSKSLPRAVKVELPKVELPKIEMPKITFPKIVIPWGAIAASAMRIAKPVLVGVAIVGVVVVNPLRWLPKIELPKMASSAPAAPKVASANSGKASASKKVAAAKSQQAPAIKLASVAPVPVTVQPQPAAAAPVPAPKTEPLELSVAATKATWIRVRADGKLVSQQRLERGAKEKWIAKKSFDVVVAKPSQVELSLNGQSINGAAIQNEGRLAITHAGIAKLADDAT